MFANNMVDPKPYLDFDPAEIGIDERVRFTVFKDLLDQYSGEELKDAMEDALR